MVHALRLPADGGARARARQPAAQRAARAHPHAHRQQRDLPAGHDPPRHAHAAGGRRRRHPDRSAHHDARRDLRRLLRPAGGDDGRGRGAGAPHRRAGRAAVRAAARRRPLSHGLRAPGRAAGVRQRRRGPGVHAALHRRARDVRAPASGAVAVDAPAVAGRRGTRGGRELVPSNDRRTRRSKFRAPSSNPRGDRHPPAGAERAVGHLQSRRGLLALELGGAHQAQHAVHGRRRRSRRR